MQRSQGGGANHNGKNVDTNKNLTKEEKRERKRDENMKKWLTSFLNRKEVLQMINKCEGCKSTMLAGKEESTADTGALPSCSSNDEAEEKTGSNGTSAATLLPCKSETDSDSDSDEDFFGWLLKEDTMTEQEKLERRFKKNVAAKLNLLQDTVKKPAKRKKHDTEALVEIATQRFSSKENNMSTAITNSWSVKLDRMNPEQRKLCEKFVEDILFEGQMGTLNINSVQINATSSYPTSVTDSRTSSPILPNYMPSQFQSNISMQFSSNNFNEENESSQSLSAFFSSFTGV